MADDGKDVRKVARAVLMRDYDGDHEGALERAGELAREHPGSAIALRLVGDLNHAAAIRARKVIAIGGKRRRAAEQDASAHLAAARDALSEARRLVPDCVGIATALGDVLLCSSMPQKAEQAYTSALSIPLPVDPALHNAAYGLHGRDRTTVDARVKDAREKASLAYGRFKKQLVDEWVADMLQSLGEVSALLRKNPRASAKEILKAQLDATVEARKKAKIMAEAMPNSARAQCFRGHMDLNFVRLLDEAIDKRSALRRSTLTIADRAAERFPKSVVIASFRAKLLYILGDYDAAERDCRRGYAMKNPDDPADDCIPPGSIGGENQGARLVTHVSEFHELINKIVRAANLYWNSMTQEQRGELLSVRFDELQEDYNKVDRSSFTMSDVLRFGEEHKSYRFWVCPLCDGHSKKHTDTVSLLSHMGSKHQRAVLPRLQSVLDQELDRSAFDGDEYSFNRVTFSQDSDQHDIVCFEERDQMFKWLFDKPSSGVPTLPLAELIETKRRTGAMLLENMKEKLKTLATDKSSTEFAEALPGIQELWIKFVKESAVDYRALILAIGRSLLWRKLKKCMSEDPEVGAKRISAADIDEMLAIVACNSGGSAVEDKTKAHMSSRSDVAQKMNGNHQQSDFHAENRSSGTIVNMKPQGPPTNMDENGNKLDEQMEKLDIDPNSARPSAIPQSSTPNENGAPHILGSSSQFSDETAKIYIYRKSVDVLNQNSEDIFFLHLIIQTIWNLRPFRDDFLKRPPVSFQLSHNDSCISDIFYDIFSAWEKNDHHGTYYSLTSLKNNLCQTVNDKNIFEKLRAGKYFASMILAIVLEGLPMSEASLHFYFNDKIQGQVVSPIICEDCICRAHVLFGMRFLVRMSCRCGACFDEGEYSTFFHKLDAGSPQTPKIKSFADLPVVIDELLCYQDKCQSCGNLNCVGHFLLNTPHFFTVVLNCTDSSKSHVSLSKLLVGCTSPPDITLATKYTLASMICCSDGRMSVFLGTKTNGSYMTPRLSR